MSAFSDVLHGFIIPTAREKAGREVNDPNISRESLLLAGNGVANVQLLILSDFMQNNGIVLDDQTKELMNEFAALSGRIVQRIAPATAAMFNVGDAVAKLEGSVDASATPPAFGGV